MTVSKLRIKLENDYNLIQNNCAIITASCRTFAPYLLNMLYSLHWNFPNHPKVYVFDLGMTSFQLKELENNSYIQVEPVPSYMLTPFWKGCYSWKHYAQYLPSERYKLYLDAGSVVLRPLYLWFLSIKKWGYFSISQGQELSDITPAEYYVKLGLNHNEMADKEVFAAGIFGFDNSSFAANAVKESRDLAQKGWTLGFSKAEQQRFQNYGPGIIRECKLFRHDQTIINLCLRKWSKEDIYVRRPLKYIGTGGKEDHAKQFLWSSRRCPESLIFYWRPVSYSMAYFVNRLAYCVSKNLKNFTTLRRVIKMLLRYKNV